MLTSPEFAEFDVARLASMRADVQDMMIRQDAYRREAESIGVCADCTETFRLVQKADTDAKLLVEVERLLSDLLLAKSRPAPVLRIVPRKAPDSVRSIIRLGVLERVKVALGRQPESRVA